MERETETSAVILREDENLGTVQIADDVVAMITSLAASEVEGVYAMAGNITNEMMSKVRMKKLTRGVKVDILGEKVRVNLAVTMDYGYNIPGTSQKVQEKVKNAIENMTGLHCTDVNVRIAAINMKKDRV
jgi:uncharacterized alkaline shock family protein YloU